MKNLIWKLMGSPVAALAWVVLLAGMVTGCQTAGSGDIAFSSTPWEDAPAAVVAGEGPRIAVGDMVKVTFSGTEKQIPPHEEQVKQDGTITLPLIGAVKAEGKSTGELQKEIHDKYVPLYYMRLTVTVSTDRQVYYVQGQVRNPGRQQYIGQTTVLKAVASAGDFTDFADRKRVVLTRADGTRVTVDCERAAKDPTYDVPVYPGDKIEVPLRRPFSF